MPPSNIRSWHRILDAIRDFETSMGGGNQSNGKEVLSRQPYYMRPTRKRMEHLRQFYMEIRYATLVFGAEMSEKQLESSHDATARALESIAESFERITRADRR